MKKEKPVRLVIDPTTIDPGKNRDGSVGEKCNNCGGYGYTIKLKGGTLPCTDCKESGVRELTRQELQAEVYSLKQELSDFRSALLKDLGFQGMKVPKNIRSNHVQ